MPFREIDDVLQPEAGLQRRWFQTQGIDLLVDVHGQTPRRLSLTYTWQNQPMQLFVSPEQRHNCRLDDGESRPGRMKSTPIAESEAALPADFLRQHFHPGDGLPDWLSAHVRALLDDY